MTRLIKILVNILKTEYETNVYKKRRLRGDGYGLKFLRNIIINLLLLLLLILLHLILLL